VYKSGKRRNSPHFGLRALRHQTKNSTQTDNAALPVSPAPTRAGISISQKVSKRAVIRNRIKRQIRAALRQLIPRLSPGWDIVIVVYPPAVECNYRQILQELEQLLAQAEVINGHKRRSLL
jgi:ribonuclease P protein component